MKKLKSIVLLLVFAIVITGAGYAESIGADVIYSGGIVAEQTGAYQDYLKNPSAYTVIPEPVEFGKSESSAYLEEVMPEKYNTETDAGKDKKDFPAVRDQNIDGDCWAFANTAAQEYSNVVLNNKSYKNDNEILSEYHMAAAMNYTNDEGYKTFTWDNKTGGNTAMAVAYMSRETGGGSVLLKDFDNSKYSKYTGDRTDYSSLLGIDRAGKLISQESITNLYEGSSVLDYSYEDGSIKNIKYHKNESVINAIKAGIMKYGAVAVSYLSNESHDGYYNSKTGAYCGSWSDLLNGTAPDNNKVSFYQNDGSIKYKFNTPTNHAVTLIGWDDNYSYTNFKTKPSSYDGKNYNYENGAWIVRNSWGSDWANDGYEYISYMDPTIGFSASGYKFSDETDENIYSYDYVGLMGSISLKNSFGCTYQAIRFETSGKEPLKSIGLYALDMDDTFEIMVDSSPKDTSLPMNLSESEFKNNRVNLKDPDTGVISKSVQFSSPGYKVLDLAAPIDVNGSFYIYVRQSNDSKTSTDEYRIAGCTKGVNASYYQPEKNVCFYSSSKRGDTINGWGDIYLSGYNWCIKAYTGSNSLKPSASPLPTASPTQEPIASESPSPTSAPTKEPVVSDSPSPTSAPTQEPMVSESPNPTSAPTQEPIVTDSPTVTPTFAPVVSPTAEPIVSPYPEKFGEPEIVVNKAEQTVDVTVTRVDASCEDSAVLVGIYNSNGILVGFRKITPVFDENGTFMISGVEYGGLNANTLKVFIWSDMGDIPYLDSPQSVDLN